MAISASASTLLLLGRDGALWTRRYDFDTGGENDLLRYSYVVDGPDGRTRRLPAEDWSRQPDPPAGRLTNHVAIAQDGKGDAARILRVEAERDGEAGYWEKPIEGAEWSWQAMDGAVGGAFLDTLPASSPAAAPEDVAVVGVLAREDVESDVMLELLDFNLVCSPARARLRRGGADIRVDGAPVELTFHHVPTTVEEVRPDDALDQDVPIPVRAALVLDLDWIFVDDPGDRDALIALFGEREVVNFIGTATRTRLELGEIPLFMAARVPAREKGHKGELFSLTAAVAAP